MKKTCPLCGGKGHYETSDATKKGVEFVSKTKFPPKVKVNQ